jgi:TRAP-type C4-dicarboxylate transport system permease small subunit
MKSIRLIYDRALEAIAVIMIVTVTAIVTMGFVYRGIGDSLAWYDEVASVALAWLTYYAGALAALRGAHIGFAGFVNSLPANWRVAAAAFSSAVTIFFFGLLTVVGIQVVDILGGDTLVSLPWVPLRFTDSVIPIAGALFVVAELLRLPELLAEARRRPLTDHELQAALEHAQSTGDFAGGKESRS